MPLTITQLRKEVSERFPTSTELVPDEPVGTVSTVKATGKEGYIRVQWARVGNADGYQIAVMTDKNLKNPDVGIWVVLAPQRQFDYPVGNVVLTRNFAVRAFKGLPPHGVGSFSSIKSATSALTDATTSTGATEPTDPGTADPTAVRPPTGLEDPGDLLPEKLVEP